MTDTQKKWLLHANIVLPHKVVQGGSLLIEGGRIAGIYEHPLPDEIHEQDERIDAGGKYLLPGLIDIHCDAIEKEVEPRPKALFPMDMAIIELEKKLAAAGITTMYHSVSLGVGLSVRGDDLLVQLIGHIRKYRNGRARIRHRIHLRYELIHKSGLELARTLVLEGAIDYLSFMNHAPGQGQYNKPGSFEAYVMKNQGVNREEVKEIVENAVKMQEEIDWTQLKALADLAQEHGIRMASHDDDSEAKVDLALNHGISVSEFPINPETAQYAASHNLSVCVGAPNVVRGSSHDGNLQAMDAIRSGSADILCSDYMPSSLLAAVFKAADQDPARLPQAVNMASLNPAKALGVDNALGSIALGKKADLLMVSLVDGWPFVSKTFVNGTCVYAADFYRNRD